MASVTLTDNQWRALRNQVPKGAPAGGSVVIDVTTGDLTVTHFPQPNGAGVAQRVAKFGAPGQPK